MEIFGTKTFTLADTATEQAMKTLEEAAEFFMAVREYERDLKDNAPFAAVSMEMAINEGADVIQTILNAFEKMGLYVEDVYEAMDRCYKRNKARGRVE